MIVTYDIYVGKYQLNYYGLERNGECYLQYIPPPVQFVLASKSAPWQLKLVIQKALDALTCCVMVLYGTDGYIYNIGLITMV